MNIDEYKECKECGLHSGRKRLVHGHGDKGANILLLGNTPTAAEEQSGRAFDSREGSFIRRMLQIHGIPSHHFYVTNIVRCRPEENKSPTYLEQTKCWQWTEHFMHERGIKVVVSLGKAALYCAAMNLRCTGKVGKKPIASLVGSVIKSPSGIIIFPMYEASYLLTNNSLKKETIEHIRYLELALPLWSSRK